MTCFYHLANILTDIDNEAEDLAFYRQACIYRSGSILSISNYNIQSRDLQVMGHIWS